MLDNELLVHEIDNHFFFGRVVVCPSLGAAHRQTNPRTYSLGDAGSSVRFRPLQSAARLRCTARWPWWTACPWPLRCAPPVCWWLPKLTLAVKTTSKSACMAKKEAWNGIKWSQIHFCWNLLINRCKYCEQGRLIYRLQLRKIAELQPGIQRDI